MAGRRKPRVGEGAPPLLARLPAGMVPLAEAEYRVADESERFLTPTEERRERELEDILDAIGSDGRVRIWHVIEGKATFAGEMSMQGFTLDVLLDTFGGGDKSLVFYQGKSKVDAARVSLDPSIPIRNPKHKGGAVVMGAAPGGVGVGDVTAMMTAMSQQGLSSMQMMQTMMAASAASQASMMQSIVAMMTARPERNSLDDVVKIAEVLKPAGGSGGSDDMLKWLDRGLNLAGKIGGGDEDGTMGVVREGLGVIAKIVENNGGQRRGAVAARPVLPAPQGMGAPAGLAGSAASGPGAGDTASVRRVGDDVLSGDRGGEMAGQSDMSDRVWVRAARPSMPLLGMAIGNVTPHTAASMIADRLSEDAFGDLLDDIEHDGPDAFMQRFEGYFGLTFPSDDTRAWMRACLSALQEMMEPDDDGDPAHPESEAPV